MEAIETQGHGQPQTERKEPGSGVSGEENKVERVALHEDAEPVRQTKVASQHIEEISSVYLLVAAIIATVTFTATLKMPGGYYSDGQDRLGMAI